MDESMGKIPIFRKNFFFLIFLYFSDSTDPENIFWIKRNSYIDETWENFFQESVHVDLASCREKTSANPHIRYSDTVDKRLLRLRMRGRMVVSRYQGTDPSMDTDYYMFFRRTVPTATYIL